MDKDRSSGKIIASPTSNGQSNTIALHAWPENTWYMQASTHEDEDETKHDDIGFSHDRIIVIDGMYEMSVIEVNEDDAVWRKVITPEKPPVDAFRSEHGSCLVPEHGSEGNTKASIILMGGLGSGAADTIKKDLYQTVVSVAAGDDHQSWNERTASGTLPDNRSNHSMTLVQLRNHEAYVSKNKASSQLAESHMTREKLGPASLSFRRSGKSYKNDLYALELDGSFQFLKEKIVPNNNSDREVLVHPEGNGFVHDRY